MWRLLASLLGSWFLASAGPVNAQIAIVDSGGGPIQTLNFTARAQRTLPRNNQQTSLKPGTATLHGRVFAVDSGQPLRKVQVRITSADPGVAGQPPENRLATTDADGRYVFKELPAGRYTLNASKSGYLSLAYGQRRPAEPGKSLDILDGQTVEKVDFSLPRGGVIAGRILDEFGDPVSDVQVSVIRYQYAAGGRRLVTAGRTGMTNDMGEFRVFALPAGDYYVSALLRNTTTGDTDDRSGYAPTYYPGTADITTAQRLTIGLGQTISDITLPLMAVRAARVSGMAIDSEGRPMPGSVLVVQRLSIALRGINATGQVRPDGSFTIDGVAPGDYTLHLTNGAEESAAADVTVGGNDVTDVRLTPMKPSTATGRLIMDPVVAQSLRPSTLRVVAQPAPVGGVLMGTMPDSGPINDDLTFQVKARPGLTRFAVTGQPAGWMVKSVRYRGVDVTDDGIDVKPNEDIGDIEVELTNHVTDVSGGVTNRRSEMVNDCWVVLFARDRDRWKSGRYVRGVRPGQDGRFKANGLPAGEYFAVAVEFLEVGEWNDPEFLDGVQTRATRFSLGEGENKILDLKLTQ